MARLSSFFRLFTGARFKIVWTTYQIIGSVAWGVGVRLEPFKSFTAGLQLLYFVAVGGECFELGYNYYSKLLLMTLWPIAVIVAGVITLVAACCTPDEGKERIREHFASMFIAYIVMPSNSVFLLRIFLCDWFGDDLSYYYLKADYGVQCWIPQHYAMIAYAIVMIVVTRWGST